MTIEQIKLRASNKIEAKLFYAVNELHELELKRDGVINTVIDEDKLDKMIKSQKAEVETLHFISDLIDQN